MKVVLFCIGRKIKNVQLKFKRTAGLIHTFLEHLNMNNLSSRIFLKTIRITFKSNNNNSTDSHVRSQRMAFLGVAIKRQIIIYAQQYVSYDVRRETSQTSH